MTKEREEWLVNERVRLIAERDRLRLLVATHRPDVQSIRNLEVRLRDWLTSEEFRLAELSELHQLAVALLPTDDCDLPSIDELAGIWADEPES